MSLLKFVVLAVEVGGDVRLVFRKPAGTGVGVAGGDARCQLLRRLDLAVGTRVDLAAVAAEHVGVAADAALVVQRLAGAGVALGWGGGMNRRGKRRRRDQSDQDFHARIPR